MTADSFDKIERSFPDIKFEHSSMTKIESDGTEIPWVSTLKPAGKNKHFRIWNMIWLGRFQNERKTAERYFDPTSTLIFESIEIGIPNAKIEDLYKEANWPHIGRKKNPQGLRLELKNLDNSEAYFNICPKKMDSITIHFKLLRPWKGSYSGNYVNLSTEGSDAILTLR